MVAGASSSDSALGFDHDFDLGPSIDPSIIDLSEDGENADSPNTDFAPGFDTPFEQAVDPRFEAECGCVFPGDHERVAVACGSAVCFDEQSYFCTYEGMAVAIGECIGLADGELDLTDYEFPGGEEAPPSSCQGNAGVCEGDTEPTCQSKAGCTFLPNGECIGAPVPCSSRIPAACTQFGGECFHVNPFEAHGV